MGFEFNTPCGFISRSSLTSSAQCPRPHPIRTMSHLRLSRIKRGRKTGDHRGPFYWSLDAAWSWCFGTIGPWGVILFSHSSWSWGRECPKLLLMIFIDGFSGSCLFRNGWKPARNIIFLMNVLIWWTFVSITLSHFLSGSSGSRSFLICPLVIYYYPGHSP